MARHESVVSEQRELVQRFLREPAAYGELLEKPLRQGAEQALRDYEAFRRSHGGSPLPTPKKDLMQDAFANAFRQIIAGKWRGDARLETWMYRITYNCAIDAARRAGRDPLHGAIPLAPKEPYSNEQLNDKAVDLERTLGEASNLELFARLRQLEENMSSLERRVVELLAEGYSFTTTARIIREEGHCGPIYPAKVKQIIGKLLREYL